MGRLLFYRPTHVGTLIVELIQDDDHICYNRKIRNRVTSKKVNDQIVIGTIVQLSGIMCNEDNNP